MFDDLIEICNKHIVQLRKNIMDYFNELKKRSRIEDDDLVMDCDAIINKANSGLSLIWNCGHSSEHSSAICPELHLAIRKHNLVSSMLVELNDSQTTAEHKREALAGFLTQENKRILKEPYSSSIKSKLFKTEGEIFLKAVQKNCKKIEARLEIEKQSTLFENASI
ncbi:hypothetical protein [Legionella micdadei]|uniref:Uncharacterized protein n=1 Tax=Legionella micdadei TaxID=451 RepID=A0A098GEH5_LEGMI|nr:hypothetical protein [Legionella micdadei]ARG97553.1 hypothetical protein B6N58_07680 [Legionella micdadei]ARH00134.1 hypothetical protein B6V88_06745 [Legionella micdadei]KTD27631.1 hypothetical protein Lmic_1951 [Legionella micdadei]NSL17614.1 hypothetical protein [Legionella micdadei]CEG60883.1 protein of unknown function [coiled-coil domain] [Legionella micdadei]